MTKVNYLILGGGIAGTTAAETIRSKDPSSSITLITEEANQTYSRVLLPHYLRNENSFESLFVRSRESFEEKRIDLLTSSRVVKVDSQEKTVTTESNTFSYDKLLIATGGKVNKLPIKGADLPEVMYLRTIEDARNIKETMARSKEALVLGGGFIGIEFAQSFVKNGLKTTAVIREKSFWDSVVGENSGNLLTQILRENGVEVKTETQVVEFLGQGKLEAVKLNNNEELKTDIVGVGIGIHLDLEHLKNSGINLNKGVLTNEFLESTATNVWAAGDIAEFYDLVSKKTHSLGNWANASAQGRLAGINMAGERTPFETTSMYSINIFNNNFSFLGDPSVDENTEIIERGDLQNKKIARLLLQGDAIVGASLINLPKDRNALMNLIKNKTKITQFKSKLADLSFDLSSIQ